MHDSSGVSSSGISSFNDSFPIEFFKPVELFRIVSIDVISKIKIKRGNGRLEFKEFRNYTWNS